MIRLPSNQRAHEAFVPFDDAFIQPPAPPESEADRPAYEEVLSDYEHKLKVARETGKWDELLVGDKQPTKFLLRPMPVEAMGAIAGMRLRNEPSEEILLLAFRICVIGVENFGKHPIEFVSHKRYGRLATTSFLDKTLKGEGGSLIAWRIIAELGSYALTRAHGNPLS